MYQCYHFLCKLLPISWAWQARDLSTNTFANVRVTKRIKINEINLQFLRQYWKFADFKDCSLVQSFCSWLPSPYYECDWHMLWYCPDSEIFSILGTILGLDMHPEGIREHLKIELAFGLAFGCVFVQYDLP